MRGIISALISTHLSLSAKKNAVDLVFCDLSTQFLHRLLWRLLGILIENHVIHSFISSSLIYLSFYFSCLMAAARFPGLQWKRSQNIFPCFIPNPVAKMPVYYSGISRGCLRGLYRTELTFCYSYLLRVNISEC